MAGTCLFHPYSSNISRQYPVLSYCRWYWISTEQGVDLDSKINSIDRSSITSEERRVSVRGEIGYNTHRIGNTSSFYVAVTTPSINIQHQFCTTARHIPLIVTCWSTPTASSPSYMMLTQPSLQDSTNRDIRAWCGNKKDISQNTEISLLLTLPHTDRCDCENCTDIWVYFKVHTTNVNIFVRLNLPGVIQHSSNNNNNIERE